MRGLVAVLSVIVALSLALALALVGGGEVERPSRPPERPQRRAAAAPATEPVRSSFDPPSRSAGEHRLELRSPARLIYRGPGGNELRLPVDAPVSAFAVVEAGDAAYVGVATRSGTVLYARVVDGVLKASRRIRAESVPERVEVHVRGPEVEVRYGDPAPPRSLRTSTVDPSWWVQGLASGWDPP